MSIYEVGIRELSGEPVALNKFRGNVLLLVNVASQCRLTYQYESLEELHESYVKQGFSVLGFPCNQFDNQEPGTAAEIMKFCSETYGVAFPMFEKIEVNGANRHPIYQRLVSTPDRAGRAGDVDWNFEKFLVAADGSVLRRFRPDTYPLDPDLITALEQALPRQSCTIPLKRPRPTSKLPTVTSLRLPNLDT